ncbi:phosphoribosylformylglycinamidine cyclo-ligase [Companilactobacillus kedongensis]|uniref:phosphoribosylformylglycinamidine cyclo-ligase n=1 Tax=Companilactobacillus kedongensis TaxID=2486004 RepID=UPI000F7A269C|nr:phosphoribosylformylglycinamidine cyclo-ligase [Companilactobacillus kedongensis]
MDPYEKAGVNVNSGYEISDFVKNRLARSASNIGHFGGVFEIPEGYDHPVLVSSNDGVGTKLLLGIQGKKHNTVGIDCVAMCVNDILAQGAKPQYFLDYIATSKVEDIVKQVLDGILKGCVIGDLELIGGETAEMPDMYAENTYDLAGFAVGIAEKSQLMNPKKVHVGDKLIGVASSGLHSNGFSLIRKIFFKDNNFKYESRLKEFPDQALGDILMTPTRIYTEQIAPLLDRDVLNGIAHITGGGFYENIPRMLPDELQAKIDSSLWEVPDIFKVVKKYGKLSNDDMFHIFNMGVGMVLAVDPQNEQSVLDSLNQKENLGFTIGEVASNLDTAVKLVGEL